MALQTINTASTLYGLYRQLPPDEQQKFAHIFYVEPTLVGNLPKSNRWSLQGFLADSPTISSEAFARRKEEEIALDR